MHKKLPTLFASIALIVAGSLALADSLSNGSLLAAGDRLPPVVWMAAFAGLSALALVAYLVSGVAEWGWLFPAGVFGGLAVMLGLVTVGFDGAAIATPLFAGLAVPFVVAFGLDRARRGWALIPAGVMAALALLLLVVDRVSGEWVGAGVLFAIAGAFLVVYLMQPARKWAALVAYILAVVGCMPLMATAERAPLAGVAMLAAIGLPFLGMYLTSPARWWAIIPAGLLLTAAGLAALETVFGLNLDQTLGNALMLAGASATFAVVGLRHQKRGAGVAAVVLGLIAVGLIFFQGAVQIYVPILLVAAGLYLLYRALRPRLA